MPLISHESRGNPYVNSMCLKVFRHAKIGLNSANWQLFTAFPSPIVQSLSPEVMSQIMALKGGLPASGLFDGPQFHFLEGKAIESVHTDPFTVQHCIARRNQPA